MRAWPRDLLAGAIASVITLAGWLTVAFLPYASLGSAAPAVGIPAACITVALGGLIVASLGQSAMPAAGLSSATVLIFASAVVRLGADPALTLSRASDLAALVAVASVSVALMGCLQVLFGAFRLGNVAKYVPHPVLAGFMSGVAILVILAQVPLLLGDRASATGAVSGTVMPWQWGGLLIGAATASVAWLSAWRWSRAPAALIGLIFGCAFYALLSATVPELGLSRLTGSVASRSSLLEFPLLRAESLALDLLRRHADLLLVTAILLAVVGSLESILGALATDLQVNRRHDANRELIVFGLGNVVVGILGGLPLVYWRIRALSLLRNGGSTARAAVCCALATGLLYLLGGGLIALLPVAVLAGLMIAAAWGLIDGWTRDLVRRAISGERTHDLWLNFGLVAVVCGVTIWRGFVVGVVLGVLLAMALFIHAMNRSLVRARRDGRQEPSRRIYPAAQAAYLEDARHSIMILELEGALFFGNVDRLTASVSELNVSWRFVILDLKRISTVDASGAVALEQLATRLSSSGRQLLLASVSDNNRHERSLRAHGTGAQTALKHWFADIDRAVEYAEQCLLAEAGLTLDNVSVSIDDSQLLQGLSPQQRDRVRARMAFQALAANESLFSQGDPGDCLYVLTRGSLTVTSSVGLARSQRYLSLSPGMMLGETAMLDGRGRSADAVADMPSEVHILSRESLVALGAEDPDLAWRLTTNIAVHLSDRLRHNAVAWRASA